MSIIEVICGPMFSGKSEELIRRLKRIQISKKKVMAFKPVIDNRYGRDIVSHSGGSIEAHNVSGTKEMVDIVKKECPDVVGIDEAQFFDSDIVSAVEKMAQGGIHVILSGLDKDFRGEPFGQMPLLLTKADYVTKFDAVSMKC